MTESPLTVRDKIFVSHASPEDNEFTKWLALQLIREGFPVWCDLIKLKGGEDFWKDIQSAIRNRSIKFLYVLSKASNVKGGPLDELATARSVQRSENLKDFVIPLSIDDLPPTAYNIELHRLNAIKFTEGWAKGFNTLIEKLDKDGVGKASGPGAGVVASWWREQYSADRGVLQESEELLSSWFPLGERPQDIYYHLTWEPRTPLKDAVTEPRYPTQPYKSGVMSFAPREDFENVLINGSVVADTHRLLVNDLFEGKHEETVIAAKEARKVVVYLLDQAWRKAMESRGLHAYELANKNWCYYFAKGQIENDKIHFTGVEGEKNRRTIVGYRKFKKLDGTARIRHWHFAVSARAQLFPTLAYNVKTHVLFSDDGENIWESDRRLHRARMSQCALWWNDDWRDRLLAVMSWLAEGKETVRVPLGGNVMLDVAKWPMTIVSPFSYIPPAKGGITDPSLREDDEGGEVEAVEDEYLDDEEDE